MTQARITIMLDEKLQRKIREMQAKQLRESNQSVSFSSVINKILADALKVKLE